MTFNWLKFILHQEATRMKKKNNIGSIKKIWALALDLPTSTWSKWCHTLHIELIMEQKWEIMSHSCTIIQPDIILITIWDISSQISKRHEFGHIMSYADSWWQCCQQGVTRMSKKYTHSIFFLRPGQSDQPTTMGITYQIKVWHMVLVSALPPG